MLNNQIDDAAKAYEAKLRAVRLSALLKTARDALTHAQQNMPHPDQMIDDAIAAIEQVSHCANQADPLAHKYKSGYRIEQDTRRIAGMESREEYNMRVHGLREEDFP